jgi:Na+/serine symporter
MDSIIEGNEKDLILVRLYVGSYQTLRPWHDYIYVGALCCNQQYSKAIKNSLPILCVYLFSTFIYCADHERRRWECPNHWQHIL